MDFIEEYTAYKTLLAGFFEEEDQQEDASDKPVADEWLMKSVFEGIKEAADNMDCDVIEEILQEMEEYSVPESDKEKFEAVCKLAAKYDYDGILEVLNAE